MTGARSTGEVREQVEQTRDHGHPEAPVTPGPLTQKELEEIEEAKREQNRQAQEQADGQTAQRGPDEGRTGDPEDSGQG